jgi:hypothetical protein
MPPLEALQFMRKIPNIRVTVVKEKVRLILDIEGYDRIIIDDLLMILNG